MSDQPIIPSESELQAAVARLRVIGNSETQRVLHITPARVQQDMLAVCDAVTALTTRAESAEAKVRELEQDLKEVRSRDSAVRCALDAPTECSLLDAAITVRQRWNRQLATAEATALRKAATVADSMVEYRAVQRYTNVELNKVVAARTAARLRRMADEAEKGVKQ